MTEIRTEPVRAGAKWRRPAFAAAAVAAAAAIAFTVLPSSGPGAGDGTPPPPSKQTVALLEDMAMAAESGKPYGEIRDDQFVYVESRVSYSMSKDGQFIIPPPHRQEIWTSVDGLHTGLKREEGEAPMDLPPDVKPGGPGWEVSTFHNHVKTLPTTADRMWDYLYRTAPKYSENETYEAMFQLAGDLLANSIMPPEQGAALFRAVARIPGVTLNGNAVDAAGRPGVSVARDESDNDLRDEWIFDAKTYAFLGERTVATADLSNVKKGDLMSDTAILRRAVVDKAGRRP